MNFYILCLQVYKHSGQHHLAVHRSNRAPVSNMLDEDILLLAVLLLIDQHILNKREHNNAD